MKITVTSHVSLELVQVRTKKTTIGLGSSRIKIERNNANGKCNLYIFVHLDDASESIILRLRAEVEPFHEREYMTPQPNQIRPKVNAVIQCQRDEASTNPSTHGEHKNRSLNVNSDSFYARFLRS